MRLSSLSDNIEFNNEKPKVDLLFETTESKELRILMKKGQEMKSHKAPHPIIVQLFSGALSFGLTEEKLDLEAGDLLYLEAHVEHDLKAKSDCIIRLTINKKDDATRVKEVTES